MTPEQMKTFNKLFWLGMTAFGLTLLSYGGYQEDAKKIKQATTAQEQKEARQWYYADAGVGVVAAGLWVCLVVGIRRFRHDIRQARQAQNER